MDDSPEAGYKDEAWATLDRLEAGDPHLYNAVVEAIDFVFDHTETARHHASVLRAAHGLLFETPVQHPRQPPYSVLWQIEDGEPVIWDIGSVRPPD
jgi:hypothetical protein